MALSSLSSLTSLATTAFETARSTAKAMAEAAVPPAGKAPVAAPKDETGAPDTMSRTATTGPSVSTGPIAAAVAGTAASAVPAVKPAEGPIAAAVARAEAAVPESVATPKTRAGTVLDSYA